MSPGTLRRGHEDLRAQSPGHTVPYRAWGRRGDQLLVLIHGGLCNATWWDHIAPTIHHARVVAPDLGGHGLSGWRPGYAFGDWADEVLAVIAAEIALSPGDQRPVVLAGHSTGGWVAMVVAARSPLVAGIVIIDSATGADPVDVSGMNLAPDGVPAPVVRTERAALESSMHTFPPEPEAEPALLQHIARHSVRRVDGGWSWQFDPRLFLEPQPMQFEEIQTVTCEVALVRAEHGLATKGTHAHTRSALKADACEHVIRGSGHHVLLSRPDEVAQLLRRHLGLWGVPGATTHCRADVCRAHNIQEGP